MRPATDRLRECQGVSGLLNNHEQRVVFVSQSVLECHGAVVKTVVKTEVPIVHPRVVMETLGHSQMSLTMDTYSHVIPALQREAADRMESVLAAHA
jgi:hypothetical protein